MRLADYISTEPLRKADKHSSVAFCLERCSGAGFATFAGGANMKIVFAASLFRACDVTARDAQLRVVFINKIFLLAYHSCGHEIYEFSSPWKWKMISSGENSGAGSSFKGYIVTLAALLISRQLDDFLASPDRGSHEQRRFCAQPDREPSV